MNRLIIAAAALIGVAPGARAQDTRQVVEPTLPPACAVLIATRTGPFESAADDTDRIQQAISHCAAGRSVRLAASNQHKAFTAGPFTLASGVTLVIEAGATLYASTDPARYDKGGKLCGGTTRGKAHGCRTFITAIDTQGSGIMGDGAIDGRGGERIDGKAESWWQIARRAQREGTEQNVPHLIDVARSKDFTLYRITLKNSPNFHVALYEVDGFTAWGVRIDTPADARNTDGIDPVSSRNVTITRSFIRTGDDDVAIKAGSAGPSENISVIDNHFYSGHGMSIGSETDGGVRHVRVQDLSMDGTTSGLRIKSDVSRGGQVRDVRYVDVCLRDVKAPIDVASDYGKGASGGLIPVYEDILFENVHSLTGGRVVIKGHDAGSPVKATFRNVQVDGTPRFEVEHAQLSPAENFTNGTGPSCERGFPAFPAKPEAIPRPQLTAEQAGRFTISEVFKFAGEPGREAVDPWDPQAGPLATGQPDYTVDPHARANGSTVFNGVQAAVDRAVVDARGRPAGQRVQILVKPGIYRELVYVPRSGAAITLAGEGTDAAATVITADLDASVTGEAYAGRYGPSFAGMDPSIQAMFDSLKVRSTLGTFGSYTVWVKNAGFQARNITFENGYRRMPVSPCVEDCRAGSAAASPVSHQAVALGIDGADRVRFENVRLLGLQDTLYMKTREGGRTARVFFDESYIEGDVDFIFGDATAFFYRSEIRSLGARKNSYVGAPDTNVKTRYGLVFDHCEFTNDGSANALAGNYNLARQWFHDQKCTPYGAMAIDGYACSLAGTSSYSAPRGTISKPVLETVGKMVVLNSKIGSHINRTNPWADWNQSGRLSFRPVQFSSDDYWAKLIGAGLDPVEDLGYERKPSPPDIFLGEYNDRPD
jgi:pectin methylesterase-like acyl-CoA thioesterase/polygalacturonase